MGFLLFLHIKYMENWEAIKSSTHSFILTVQEMFQWKLRKFKISYLSYFSSDLHQIGHCFYSLYWINLNLDRISPLAHSWRNVFYIPWGTCPSELSWPWWVWRSCSQSTAAWSVGRAASGWSSPEFPLFVSVPSFRWCTSPFCNKVISFK